MRSALRRLLAVTAGALLLCASPAPGAASKPWVFISDIHYGPWIGGSAPSMYDDTNEALMRSLFADLRAHDPDPPVVVIGGDFLAHHFPLAKAQTTLVALAHRFDALYPHAQFVIVLGNNDSSCGDYAPPMGGSFLAAVTAAWAPLVDRHGAAPAFRTSFARDGSYVATLPIRGLHVVAIDDVGMSLRAQSSCAQGRNLAAIELDDVARGLARLPKGDHAWLLLHIPPGIDAYSTMIAHRLAAIPFLRPGARNVLERKVTALHGAATLVIASHTHKFAYRIVPGDRPVPALLVPSVSPIFGNAPMYLEVGVASDGTLANVRERALGWDGWHDNGSLADLGVARFDVTQLRGLQMRLAHEAPLRREFARLYEGRPDSEITEHNWPLFWCAATAMGETEYGACTAAHHLALRTLPALIDLAAVLALVLIAVVIVVLAVRRGRAQARTG